MLDHPALTTDTFSDPVDSTASDPDPPVTDELDIPPF